MKFKIITRDQGLYPISALIADDDNPETLSALYDIASEMYSAGTAFDLPVGGTIEIERIA